MINVILPLIYFSLTSCSNNFKPAEIKNSERSENSPYVILISVDGMRHDYIEKYKPPTLKFLFEEGLSAKSLIPIFPSKTFPNHYSIITGMYAENHGLIANSFYDPKLQRKYSLGKSEEVIKGEWYGGEPLWVTAKKNKLVSASFFWVGSEADIQGHRPDYFFKYDGSIPGEKRVDQIIDWLKLPSKLRPHFITLYFSEVDSAGHKYGPISKEVKSALYNIDDYIHRLLLKISKLNLDINIILVSDHGMTNISNKRKIEIPDTVFNNPNLKIVGKGSLSLIYKNNKNLNIESIKAKLKKLPNLQVYDREDMPKNFNFRNHRRIPALTLSPDLGYYITNSSREVSGGTHGYDPSHKDMHGVFLALGPNIESRKIESFENVHIYPFVAEILGLKYSHQIDGKKNVLKNFIRKVDL